MKKFNWFIKDNKDSEVDDTTNQEQSFFKRMKNDSKYKAKVELTGYAIFIIVLIIFLNIFNTGSTQMRVYSSRSWESFYSFLRVFLINHMTCP